MRFIKRKCALINRMVLLAVQVVCLSAVATVSRAGETPASGSDGWRLVWSDEFNQADGSAPNIANWNYDLGGHGWGNDELECYTDRTNNVRVANGKLVIEARHEDYDRRHFTSGRLQTRGKRSWTYGKFVARVKIPRGQGMWPAFWMLGTNITSVGWPNCGEIDIMENIGCEPGTIHGTIHGPGYSGNNGIGEPVTLPNGAAMSDDFHLFAVECDTNRIAWSLDGKDYFQVCPTNLPPGRRWVFNAPKFLLLNLAVGGKWPGNPDETTVFPQRMMVDYVRVYERSKENGPATDSPR